MGTREFIGEIVSKVEGIMSCVAVAGFGKTMAVRTKQRVDLVMRDAKT